MTSLEILHNLAPVNLASLSFVYVLLPVSLLVFYLAPKRLRLIVLLASSAGLYFLAAPGRLLLVAAVAAVNYIFVSAVVMLRGKLPRKLFMLSGVAANLVTLGYFSVAAQLEKAAPPLGFLVICVSGIDAILEAYCEDEPQTRNVIRFALYLTFFPRLYAGPLANPEDFYASCGNARFDTETVLTGFGRFAEGLMKYAAIGRSLFFLYESIRAIPGAERSVLSAWLLIFAFAFALYFTLTGLTDIARGIAGMFGIALPQNSYYPYQSRSVSDFFERFNMTLCAFLRRRVLAPLSPDPEKSDSVADAINILLVGMLWGLWFGIRVNCFLWGIFIAAFMIMEKYFYPRVLAAIPTLFCRFYAFFTVLLSLALFAGDTFADSLGHFSRMFGAGGVRLYNGRILYILSMNWVLLVIAAILSTNLISLLISGLRKAFPRASLAGMAVIDAGALILFTSLTLGGGIV